MRQLCRLLPFLVLFTPFAFPQTGRTVQFKVVLVWANGGGFSDKQDVEGMPGVQGTARDSGGEPLRGNSVTNMSIRIAVLNDVGQTVSESSPSNEGSATFDLVGSVRTSQGLQRELTYRVRVYGAGIEEENIESVTPASEDRILTVTIRRKGEKNQARGGLVSANALKIPGKAEKEFGRGSKALDLKKLPEARDHFQRAIELYPSYDLAYNGLGATLIEMGDVEGGRKAFEKSVAVNDKFASGYRNLAKIAAQQKDYMSATSLLERSLSLEPMNVEALSRLAQFDFLLGKDTEVPELARRVHSLPHAGQELAHYAAASSLERMNKPDEAIGEYSLFLKEAPDSPLVAAAKTSIERCRQKLNEPTTR
jgi:hypothetical protein